MFGGPGHGVCWMSSYAMELLLLDVNITKGLPWSTRIRILSFRILLLTLRGWGRRTGLGCSTVAILLVLRLFAGWSGRSWGWAMAFLDHGLSFLLLVGTVFFWFGVFLFLTFCALMLAMLTRTLLLCVRALAQILLLVVRFLGWSRQKERKRVTFAPNKNRRMMSR